MSESIVVPSRKVHVWSPLAVAVFSIVLAYPASLILAVKNWRELDQRDRIGLHIVGAILLSIPLVLLVYFLERKARVFGWLVNISAFAYIKAKLHSDLAEFRAAHPDAEVITRRWYTAIGWALLAMLIFVGLGAMIAVTAELALELFFNE